MKSRFELVVRLYWKDSQCKYTEVMVAMSLNEMKNPEWNENQFNYTLINGRNNVS